MAALKTPSDRLLGGLWFTLPATQSRETCPPCLALGMVIAVAHAPTCSSSTVQILGGSESLRCIKLVSFVMDGGILPYIKLSARLRKVSQWSRPILPGIWLKIHFPVRSKSWRKGREEKHRGMSPVIPVQSVMVIDERYLSLHMSREMFSVK
ncbi:hypothetical protein FH972_017783 [Carpinus fangiana]|uniref:Uncharacterized protein n=1 Tax=Carpinus fangiana TaxID=176857 RepID=A0A5N6RJX0_9ROSI|nr:hypothetical protein FH972_017783 [Carpinus fangiana]